MTYYVGILDVGPNGAWGVRIPDVPGCHGGGKSPEAAVADATSALREIAAHCAAHRIALKPPRTMLDVVRDKDVEYDGRAGETLVMVPLVLDQRRSVKANVSLDAGLLEAIDDEANRRGLTRSAFLASAALDKIEHGEAEERPSGEGRSRPHIGKARTTRAKARRQGRPIHGRKGR